MRTKFNQPNWFKKNTIKFITFVATLAKYMYMYPAL